jgi:hypothetical protein
MNAYMHDVSILELMGAISVKDKDLTPWSRVRGKGGGVKDKDLTPWSAQSFSAGWQMPCLLIAGSS